MGGPAHGQTQEKRHDEPERRDQHNGLGVFPLPQMGEVKIQADLEHEQDQSDLAHDGDRRAGNGVKHEMKSVRGQGPKQARPQQQAHDDLPHHPRLPQPPRQRTTEARRQQDDHQLQQGKK